MRIKVLGASGSSVYGYNLSSYLLDGKILFDAGSFASSLSFKTQKKIKHIFITHTHLDHIRDIPFIADNLTVDSEYKTVNVYSIREVLEDIKKNILNDRIWPDFTMIPNFENSIIQLCPIKEQEPVVVEGYTITAYRVSHTVPAVGYLVEKDGRSFFYTGDTGPAKNLWHKLSDKKINVLIVDVSFPNKMRDFAIMCGHLTPELLFEDLSSLKRKPDRIYLTHIKPMHAKQIEKELKSYSDFRIKILKGGEIIKV